AQTGQPTEILDPLGHPTNLRYRCTTTENLCTDPNGLYACEVTNAVGQTTHGCRDLRWGKPVSVTDPNSSPTTYGYDGMGRLTSVSRPGDTLPWRTFAYYYGAAPPTPPPGATPTPSSPTLARVYTLYREPNAAASYRTVATFYDSFGRPLET